MRTDPTRGTGFFFVFQEFVSVVVFKCHLLGVSTPSIAGSPTPLVVVVDDFLIYLFYKNFLGEKVLNGSKSGVGKLRRFTVSLSLGLPK